MPPLIARLRYAFATVATLSAIAPPTSAQAPATQPPAAAPLHRIAGSVLDTLGGPVPYADIRLTAATGSQQALLADAKGRFVFPAVPEGPAQLEVRRIGFWPALALISLGAADIDTTRVVLVPAAAELSPIEVHDNEADRRGALAGFYARRESNNFGHYLDRAELEATHAQRPSEALRAVPGLLIQPSPRIGNIVRIRNCRPTVWMDGVRLPEAELDEVATLDDVAAVEVYKSLAGMPQQFIDRTNPCGGILIWSRNH